MAVQREPPFARLLQDALRLLFLGVVAGAMVVAFELPPPRSPRALDLASRVSAALAAELLAVTFLRLAVPRPLPGAHRVGRHADYLRWISSAALVDVVLHPLVRGPFWFLHGTRVLYLRALGADVGWNVGLHAELSLRDPSLVAIGAGSQLEPGVRVEAGIHAAGRVLVGRVAVGRGVLVGAHTVLMPGATIGHDVRIEPVALIGEDVRVGVGATVGEGARLEKGVDLGSYVSVGTGAILSEGVRVGERAKVSPGSVVLAYTVIGEREHWEGAPARKVTFASTPPGSGGATPASDPPRASAGQVARDA